MKSVSWMMLLLIPMTAEAQWKFSGNVAPYFQKLGIHSTPVSPSEKGGISASLQAENKINSQWRFRSDTWIRSDFLPGMRRRLSNTSRRVSIFSTRIK